VYELSYFFLPIANPIASPAPNKTTPPPATNIKLEFVVAAFEEKFCAMALAAKQSTAVVVEINFESLIICAPK
jgi:hypothetical protein